MILGRPTNLIIAAFTAIFNVFVILSPATLSGEAVAAINIAFASVIFLIANQDPTVKVGSSISVVSANGGGTTSHVVKEPTKP
jgi:hypothetical protein